MFCYHLIDSLIAFQGIMVRWQPPPLSGQNGEITSYKIRYRKVPRRSESAVTTAGTELYKLIDGEVSLDVTPIYREKTR